MALIRINVSKKIWVGLFYPLVGGESEEEIDLFFNRVRRKV